MNYTTFVAINLLKQGVKPGDTILLTLRNTDSAEGMFMQMQRLSDMFLEGYHFFPEEIRVNPEQLALIKNMGKSLDVTIKDSKLGELLGQVLDCTTLPTRIPLVADETLDLFTAVARYSYAKEREEDYQQHAIEYIMDRLHKM